MTIGFIGAGNMARAIISGLLAKKAVAPTDIVLHGGQPLHYEPYAAKIGAKALASNQAVAETADIVFLAVSPKLGEPILQAIGSTLKKRHVPVVSMLTGVSVATLEKALGSHDQPVLRIMPNVNVAINAGMIAYAANDAVAGQLDGLLDLLNVLGKTMSLPEEQFSTFVALAGSSPAFIYLFIDSLARAGVKYGLEKDQATAIAAQAVMGSAKNVLASDQSPFDLIDQVSSPGGTTVAGLLAMEEAGLMTAVVKGVDATIAKDRHG
ncbi:pyrroline-5-carboxylate reductase [Lacticaseibacillus rhamnosus]|uniref:pyrroline-5-carboxylate reductase n=2 Tax=Lacticaseibacillus rhamnosus TaxID=47715 RepID=UPI0007E14ECF|nr:pyrroline-5-carboxylate reductase [Lacticaseibacillus rhamnosus]MCT3192764.1 pyrroline-5-carboxylate reductase [Lacticaseibacillus rhamnosus]MCT3373436.1 pyrroline-5-carboxylate reductase [Lacticaseibacillus rhamnosus]OAU18535.1 pyrroline-5-carboxylate reductase [Lacticaseibacillus rhamnosus]OAU20787.1 pyrroline-5-carboxylate reductase [Lacticaseibacillus rhamnosus]